MVALLSISCSDSFAGEAGVKTRRLKRCGCAASDQKPLWAKGLYFLTRRGSDARMGGNEGKHTHTRERDARMEGNEDKHTHTRERDTRMGGERR